VVRSFLSRTTWALFAVGLFLASCDKARVFEDNREFKQRFWTVNDEPSFRFVIDDSTSTYNVYYNVRNSLQYDWDRIFVTYTLSDTSGAELSRKLVYHDLFDPTGRPLGDSGIGDLYDHQFPLLNGFRFPRRGTYTIRLTQFTRQDTLRGVLAVGVRVERSGTE
jgi:gliding motility-associated lipoprotein GldH